MRVKVLAFARLREIVGRATLTWEIAEGATVGELWEGLADMHPLLRPLTESTKAARNGRIVPFSEPLRDDDEIALMPPVGGG